MFIHGLSAFIVVVDMKLMQGDELRLRYLGELHKPWSGVSHVMKVADSILYISIILGQLDCSSLLVDIS